MRKITEIRASSDSTGTDAALSDDEADALFADLAAEPVLVLAISGGPDSTALLYLMARWSKRRKAAPRLVAVTIDHGLRPQARGEAAAVKRLAGKLGVEHRTMRWTGAKPSTALQENARVARYRLLHAAARRAEARCVLTAHTLDDQAETVLFRLARGSGLAGIGGMARAVPLPIPVSADRRPRQPGSPDMTNEVLLVRPLLGLPKVRLIVTLRAAGLIYADDPSNADPRFARARLRTLMPALAGEGLTPRRLAHLAHRVRRSEAALEAVVDWTAKRLGLSPDTRKIAFGGDDLRGLPTEIALRLLGRAIGAIGDEGPVELGKLEALSDALAAALADDAPRFRRTLAGAMVSLQKDCIVIERAPARRHRSRA
jgi:tRNA(Ile)-lysidine synthase